MLGFSSDILSVISDEFNSNDLDDSLDDSGNDSEHQENQSNSFTSLLGFDGIDDDGPDIPPSVSDVPKNKASLMKQVASMATMVDEDASIASSANVSDRWSSGSSHSRWTGDLPPGKCNNQGKTLRQSAEGATMQPPRRRHSKIEVLNISEKDSLTNPTADFEMLNQQMQAEVGLRLSDSRPAQKVMEAIMSVLQTEEGESKQEEKRPKKLPQNLIEGIRRKGPMNRLVLNKA